MSSRRNGSVSRAAEAASKNRLHMDRNPQHSRINDPSNPAGRRKEIDNVMKRARQASPGSWDRKLLEVEEKDPNRWRHTGYKQLYLEGSTSPSSRRSRTPAMRRSRTPTMRRSRSPLPFGRRSRTPMAARRSPIGGRRSPIGGRRSPIGGRRSPVMSRKSRSRSPLPRAVGRAGRKSRSRSMRKSPRRTPKKSPPRRVSPALVRRPRSPPPRRESPPRSRVRPAPPRVVRPPSPPDPRKKSAIPNRTMKIPPLPRATSSGSGSSVSSCSDESCSVCSAKNKKSAPPQKPKPSGVVKRPPNAAPSAAVQPTRELLKARESSKRSREEKVLEWQRSQLAVNRPPAGAPIPPAHIKREGERRPTGPPAPPPGVTLPPRRREERGVSPAAIQAALADSESDSESDASSEPQPQRLTLSERFGKMAQWSADRSARLENMRITRRETTLHVRIERGEGDPSPERAPAAAVESYSGLDPEPFGSYPEELLAVAPVDMPSWDDVRVRYDYYKKRGYLRGLTLSDYVKWEEWWYKYQEWLKRERAYERWAEGESAPARRSGRRRGGRHRRS